MRSENMAKIALNAANDGGKRFTATFNADVILRMRSELCDL